MMKAKRQILSLLLALVMVWQGFWVIGQNVLMKTALQLDK